MQVRIQYSQEFLEAIRYAAAELQTQAQEHRNVEQIGEALACERHATQLEVFLDENS